MTLTTDMHAHLLPHAWLEEAGRKPDAFGIEVRERDDGHSVTRPDRDGTYIVPRDLSDVAERLALVDELGLDRQVATPTTPSLMYDLPASQSQALCRLYNEIIVDVAKGSGGKLIPAATVPMGSPDLAVAELRYAVERLDIRMVFIATHVSGTDLDDERFASFFRAASELGVLVQLHPSASEASSRLVPYFHNVLLSNPFETTVAAARLISGGVLDRNPELKVLLVHGGGVLPTLCGRMQHGYHHASRARQSQRPPREYMHRFFYDTVVHDENVLRFVLEAVGEGRLVIGTDAPHPMADTNPLASLRAVGLDDNEAVLGKNAENLLSRDAQA